MPELSLRFATPNDANEIFRLVSALAKYEKLEHEVLSCPVDFQRTRADPDSNVEVLLAFWSDETVGLWIEGVDRLSSTMMVSLSQRLVGLSSH